MTSRAAFNRLQANQPIAMVITLQGQRALAEDFFVLSQVIDPLVGQGVLYFGEATKEIAKQIHAPNIDTQATYDSISAGPSPGSPPEIFRVSPYGWGIDVGPFTEYAPFQEFGFTHWLSGNWIQNPFMIPAADAVDPIFTDFMVQLAEVANNRRFLSGPAAQTGAAPLLSSVRNLLYSYSKFAGDVQVLGVGGLSASRGAALRGARALGDLDAGMRGAIGTRITRRVSGRFASGGITASVSTTLTGPGSRWSGPASRIYNRFRGQAIGRGLRGI